MCHLPNAKISMLRKGPFVSNFMRSVIMFFSFSNCFLFMTISVSNNKARIIMWQMKLQTVKNNKKMHCWQVRTGGEDEI